ncbi:DUF1810 domain-containing protein [Mitsuaria sp. GD03876]|uniref:DUF1810 domain-containing protein n=1 Tax=Mitsuaria sp. GD03876 TaxID=2975399 RepID=UPI00244CD8CC|nr:DUF1810 domain-containing protein [Mitsuaria sp. GD03876]MDH0864717.1 DUF1810 domain-containing protein [Mitsuaria sp. GD03876]
MSAPPDLHRFLDAQAPQLADVLDELRRGRKRSHWMWYFFPQLRGLGISSTAQRYGISSLDEAIAYLDHEVLGPRLRECVALMNTHRTKSAEQILGSVDALKFRSSLTLFARASGNEAVFIEALDRFYDGQPDPRTLELLA